MANNTLSEMWRHLHDVGDWLDKNPHAPDEVRDAVVDRICDLHRDIADTPPETLDDLLIKMRLLAQFDEEDNADEPDLLESRLIRTMLAALETMLAPQQLAKAA